MGKGFRRKVRRLGIEEFYGKLESQEEGHYIVPEIAALEFIRYHELDDLNLASMVTDIVRILSPRSRCSSDDYSYYWRQYLGIDSVDLEETEDLLNRLIQYYKRCLENEINPRNPDSWT
jgi:hypothetical protein